MSRECMRVTSPPILPIRIRPRGATGGRTLGARARGSPPPAAAYARVGVEPDSFGRFRVRAISR